MLKLILSVAKQDDRIRAVFLNGSRANPNAKKDCLQDYDIVYIVTEMDSFLQNHAWVDVFGDRIIMQMPEAMTAFPPSLGGRFTYLMQFTDGNRIDLCLVPLSQKKQYLSEDSLTILLLDKDESYTLPNSSDSGYFVKSPTQAEFSDYCNEFWWVSTYVAKGLWRNEILYATEHLNAIVRKMLLQMLSWKVGIQHDFQVNIGKCGKYLDRYLNQTEWEQFTHSFGNGDIEHTWNALFTVCELFQANAKYVAEHFHFAHDTAEEERVLRYLRHVQQLPKDATSFD
jgi:aminoglycoside 6-adenylyltransferase